MERSRGQYSGISWRRGISGRRRILVLQNCSSVLKFPSATKFWYKQSMPMNSEIRIRAANHSDIPAITEIYTHHVLYGTGSFEIEPPSPEEMARRMFDIVGRGLPYFVAVRDGNVVGYAYAALY